jgi:23S rRNA pseudouridine1911/1915/1917 synthase
MTNGQPIRNGQWLEFDWSALAANTEKAPAALPELAQPQAGSHPHLVRQWLLARSLFPQKWINRLFSIGGIQWRDGTLQLLAFSPIDPHSDQL